MTPTDILKKYWGYDAFRTMQEDIIISVLDGKDTLALLPTGGGKSICFQVPALMLEGMCIVVSPLIALMKDQVEHLSKKGIKAHAIFSGMNKREIDITLDNCIYDDVKFLYVSPERLKTELFIERARQMHISMLAVDEAHCISQWGYDFRPPYLEIDDFRKKLNINKILALTATATKEVRADIISKLNMKDVCVFKKSFARANLSYSAFQLENKDQKLYEILTNVPGSSVIYVRSRKKSREAAMMLAKKGISSDYYHAGLTSKERSEKQDAWIHNKIRTMVATNAFGMGIDKPDVRSVIHLDLPDSLEAYYQEAGRAGRDEKKAYAVALFNTQDLMELRERADRSVVSLELIKRTYKALSNYFKLAIGSNAFESFPFHYAEFIKNFNLPPLDTYAALKKLNAEGLIQMNDGFFVASKFIYLLNKNETYKFQVANPKLDPIIKTLLRLYGGESFNSYQKIREKDLATLLKTDIGQVKKWLAHLSKQEIIDYQPSTDTPTITFLTPRLDPDKLPLDKEQIEWRKKLAIDKAEHVISYMKSENCRTMILQKYFDEHSAISCGICDNDLERKKTIDLEKLPIEDVEKALDSPRSLSELRALLSKFHEEAITYTLRLLMDDHRVVERDGQFSRVENVILRGGGES